MTNPDDRGDLSHTYEMLGMTYRAKGEIAGAERAWQKAFRLATPGSAMWSKLGCSLVGIHVVQHRENSARVLSERMLNFCKTDSRCSSGSRGDLLICLARGEADLGHKQRAEKLAAQALELYYENPENVSRQLYIQYSIVDNSLPTRIARIYIKFGDNARGEEILRKVISEHSRESALQGNLLLARAMRDLADLYVKEKRPGEAEPLYRQALSIFKNYPGFKEELAAVTSAIDGLRAK